MRALRFVDQPHGGITSLGIRADEGGKSLVYAIDFHEMTDDMAAHVRKASTCGSAIACAGGRTRPMPISTRCSAGRGTSRSGNCC